MKKFNPWPIGIATFLICFATLVIGGGIWISTHKYHLVSDDYYAKGVGYEDQIQMNARATALAEKPLLIVEQQHLMLSVPASLRGDFTKATLALYRPSQGGMDKEIPVTLDAQGQQQISLEGMIHGNWKAKLQWEMADQSYAMEQQFEVPKDL